MKACRLSFITRWLFHFAGDGRRAASSMNKTSANQTIQIQYNMKSKKEWKLAYRVARSILRIRLMSIPKSEFDAIKGMYMGLNPNVELLTLANNVLIARIKYERILCLIDELCANLINIERKKRNNQGFPAKQAHKLLCSPIIKQMIKRKKILP